MSTRPFAQSFPIRGLDDIRRLEQVPYDEAVQVHSTYEIIRNSAQAFGAKTALTFLGTANPADEPIRWSYADLLAGVHQTANLLHSLGVRRDDVIAVLLPGCLEYHLALWGGEAAGIVLPLNPLFNDEKLISMMQTARAKVLMAYGAEADAEIWSKAQRIRSQVPTLSHVLRVAPHDEAAEVCLSLPDGVTDFNLMRARQPDDRLVSGRVIAPSDIAAYFHTGGTTGAPKLARHSHGAQVFTAWACAQLQGMSPSDVSINGFPLFHVAGALPASLTALAVGMEMVIPTTALFRNREVLANYWRLVEKYRSTSLSAVPTVLAALTNVPLAGADISSVKYCRTGAAPLPPELADRFERLFGLHVHETLGMTEMAGISTITPPGVVGPAGSVGFRMPHSQLRIVALDAQGGASERDVPDGEHGMVLFKSPSMFSGFLDPADTARAFTADGWLVTGDVGWVDGEGRLHISGRAKDLIIRSGHNIDPKVIEDALCAHPSVELCAAVGAPDPYAGEIPVAFAMLRPGASASEAELLEFTEQRVDEAPAKPKRVTILNQMPMTNVGKIYKPELRLLAAQAVVTSLVTHICGETGVGESAVPQVASTGERGLKVALDAGALGAQADALAERLRSELARLPFQIELA